MRKHPSTTPAAPLLSGRPVEFNSVRGHIPSLTQTTIGRALVAKCGELGIRKRFQTTIRKHLLAREQWALTSIQAMTLAEAMEMSTWPCERCGRGFTLARVTRRFCSEECEQAASTEQHRVKQQEKQCRLALYEGPAHTFTPVRSNQKYCCPEHIRRGSYLSKLAENRAAARQRYDANAPAILLRLKKKRKDDPKWAKKETKRSKAWRERNPERAAELDKRKTDKRALVSKVLAAADRAGVKPETLAKNLLFPEQDPDDARVTLAAYLELQGVKPYHMKDDLFPNLSYPDARDQREARYGRVKQLFRRKSAELEREKVRLANLPESDRKRAAEEARHRIPKTPQTGVGVHR